MNSITRFAASMIMTAASIIMFSCNSSKEPWTESQLLAPEKLAATINNAQAVQPVIVDIGPAGVIKNAVEIGPMDEKGNVDKLRALLSETSKDKEVVIYCGCCPFKDCPNIRPAFNMLNEMHFTQPRLLNLSRNLKADWIDKGYPME